MNRSVRYAMKKAKSDIKVHCELAHIYNIKTVLMFKVYTYIHTLYRKIILHLFKKIPF